jgi:glycosyltransferase involved in cell wall biosynthesis
VLAHVGRLIVVDDGSSAAVAAELDELSELRGVELVRLAARSGKGSAVRAGIGRALEGEQSVEAVLVIDADGQHPTEAIPAFLEAARSAELVIGDRLGDIREMPWERRVANRTSRRLFALATGHHVRDTQNGMRLLRGRALEVLPPEGGYEAETRHLKQALREGVAVGWVPMPSIYAGEASSFRALRDSGRVLWAIVAPARTAGTS